MFINQWIIYLKPCDISYELVGGLVHQIEEDVLLGISIFIHESLHIVCHFTCRKNINLQYATQHMSSFGILTLSYRLKTIH